jgi:hypothetical protein
VRACCVQWRAISGTTGAVPKLLREALQHINLSLDDTALHHQSSGRHSLSRSPRDASTARSHAATHTPRAHVNHCSTAPTQSHDGHGALPCTWSRWTLPPAAPGAVTDGHTHVGRISTPRSVGGTCGPYHGSDCIHTVISITDEEEQDSDNEEWQLVRVPSSRS